MTRSKIAKRIMDGTPQEVRDKVKQYSDDLVAMTKNKIVAVFMGIKTVQHDHWAYGEVTAIVHQGIIDLPLLIYEPDKDYNHFHEAWRKFRDLKFEERNYMHRIRHHKIVSTLEAIIVRGTITEAFDELVKGIKWYNQLKE